MRLLIASLIVLSCAAAALASDPTVEAMKAELEARIQVYERLSALEKRVDKIEGQLQGQSPAPAPSVVHVPTPHPEVERILKLANIDENDVVIDPGCGDARYLIAAVEQYGAKKARGIELDPQQAALARERVKAAGLEEYIEIVEGDARTTDWGDANVAVAYLFSDLLGELKPKLLKMDTVVTYQHSVPGLSMTNDRSAYVWRAQKTAAVKPQLPGSPAPQAAVKVQEIPYAVYMGTKYYSHPNPGCNCGMCQNIAWQLASRANIERREVRVQQQPVVARSKPLPAPAATPGRVVQWSVPMYSFNYCQSGCSGGNCRRGDD